MQHESIDQEVKTYIQSIGKHFKFLSTVGQTQTFGKESQNEMTLQGRHTSMQS